MDEYETMAEKMYNIFRGDPVFGYNFPHSWEHLVKHRDDLRKQVTIDWWVDLVKMTQIGDDK